MGRVFKKKGSEGWRYFNFALSFGLTLVITVYLLYKGGTWLDARLGTAPLFMALGIILAVATVFWQLIEEMREKPEQEHEQKQK